MSEHNFGEILRSRRLERDLTLESLSAASGVSDRGIGDIERGVSVAPQVRTVRLLADALRLRGAERDEFLAAARSTRHQRRDLASTVTPNPLADFVGRMDELAHIRSIANGDDDGAVLLWGGPGIGKTSLALHAARETAAGSAPVLFADLQGLDARPASPLAVLQAILSQFASPDQFASADLGAAMRFWSEDTSRRHVVVLDNAGSEAQVRPVLANPQATVLVTSRRPLSGLENTRRLHIEPLSEIESVRLLSSLAPTLRDDGQVAAALAELCGRIPLALRIAGNRLATRPDWSAADLLSRLRNTSTRLETLRAGDLAVKNTVDLSFELLSESARSLFRACSLIDGSTFAADLPAALLGIPVHTAEQSLDELIELALVETSAGGRYRIHDLLHVYGRDRLQAAATEQEIVALDLRKVSWLLQSTFDRGRLFEPAKPGANHGTGSPDEQTQASARAWLVANAEHWLAALRSAHTAGLHQDVLRVADALHWFSDLWPRWGNWHVVFRLAVSSAIALGDRREQATHLGYLSWADRIELNDLDQSILHAQAALEAAEAIQDLDLVAWSHLYIAEVHRARGDLLATQREAEVAASLFSQLTNKEGLPQALLTLASSKVGMGKYSDALTDARRVVTWVKDPITAPTYTIARHALVNALLVAASAASGLNDPHTALHAAGEALRQAADMQLTQIEAIAQMEIGHAYRSLGDESVAAVAYARAVEMFTEAGDLRGQRNAQSTLQSIG